MALVVERCVGDDGPNARPDDPTLVGHLHGDRGAEPARVHAGQLQRPAPNLLATPVHIPCDPGGGAGHHRPDGGETELVTNPDAGRRDRLLLDGRVGTGLGTTDPRRLR